MRLKHSAALAVLPLLVAPNASQAQGAWVPSPEEWQRAVRQIRRLPPSAFKGAPRWVVEDLIARGCAVPQPSSTGEPVNLIRGQFARSGEWDWAVICSKGYKSRVIVLWGGPPACPSNLWEAEDAGRLEVMAPGEIGYDFTLLRVESEAIRKDIHNWEPPPWEERMKAITHDGIEFGSGKGANIWYCSRGEWSSVASGD